VNDIVRSLTVIMYSVVHMDSTRVI